MCETEFYRDEHPDSGGGSGDGGTDRPGIPVPSWDGPGFGPDDPMPFPGGEWGNGADDGTREPIPADWTLEKRSLPYLKRTRGNLFLSCGGRLLSGTFECPDVIPVLIRIEVLPDSEGGPVPVGPHADCLLLRLSGTARPGRRRTIRSAGASPDDGPHLGFDFSRHLPGSFSVQAKWQSGHYDHARISRARFVVFGVDLGWRTFPLGNWIDAARIVIGGDRTVTVNGIAGSLTANRNATSLE